MAKGASLLPQDYAAGGALPDGDYTIKECRAATFDYQGKGPEGPSLRLLFVDDNGTELEQHYSAGKPEFLMPSEDGKRFVHPAGEEAKLTKNSNCAAFIGSILSAGFPVAKLGDDVTAFEGTRVSIVNQAQPKRPGMKDQTEGKTIPLVTKVLSLPGEGKRPTRAAGVATKPATPTPTTAASTASSANGALDEQAIAAVQESLAEAANNTLTRVKLGTSIMLRLSKAKDPQMANIKKLAQDAAWLQAHQEEGGWQIDGDNVLLAG